MDNPYHKKLTDKQDIANAVRYINDSINGRGLNFMEDTAGRWSSIAFANSKENDHSIIILASFDFSYYHDLELVFYDVGYSNLGYEYSWWDHWTKDQLELGDEEFPDGFEFRFNRGTNSDVQYIIHAKSFSYHLERIVYNR